MEVLRPSAVAGSSMLNVTRREKHTLLMPRSNAAAFSVSEKVLNRDPASKESPFL